MTLNTIKHRALEYLRSNYKSHTPTEIANAIGVNRLVLGRALSSLLDDEFIEQPRRGIYEAAPLSNKPIVVYRWCRRSNGSNKGLYRVDITQIEKGTLRPFAIIGSLKAGPHVVDRVWEIAAFPSGVVPDHEDQIAIASCPY
jgi:hypothetical protein